LFSFVGLGAFIVGLGFISLVAANWKMIPDFLKLVVDFGILTGAVVLANRFSKNQQPLWFEGTLVFILFFTLASMGLVSQIYHLSGPLYQSILLWAFLTVGVMAYSKNGWYLFFGRMFFLVLLGLLSTTANWRNSGLTSLLSC